MAKQAPPESYESAVNRREAALKAKGVSPSQARILALKWAARRYPQSNPGGTVKNTRGANAYTKLHNSVDQKFIDNFIMEIAGITGLIGSPPAQGTLGVSGKNTAATLGGGSPATTKSAMKTADEKDADGKTKTSSITGKIKVPGFKPGQGLQAKIERAKPGQVAKRPDTMEATEAEFGII
jgi:hypothetical protein